MQIAKAYCASAASPSGPYSIRKLGPRKRSVGRSASGIRRANNDTRASRGRSLDPESDLGPNPDLGPKSEPLGGFQNERCESGRPEPSPIYIPCLPNCCRRARVASSRAISALFRGRSLRSRHAD